MPRKTRTIVPTHVEIAANPTVYVDLKRPITLYIRGRRHRVIARIELGRRKISVFGARESKAQVWKYETLQLEGISD